MPPIPHDPAAVLDFWFALERPGKKHDAPIREAMGGLYEQAARGELDGWAEQPRGRLALILLLDQVPRHLFRGDPRAYATDEMAAALTAMFIDPCMESFAAPQEWGDFTALEIFYATHPWLHAEDEALQARINPVYHRIAQKLPGLEYMAAIADLYLETIRRFRRFPHRNRVLGQESTPEEARFLAEEWNQRRRDARTCPAAEANPFFRLEG